MDSEDGCKEFCDKIRHSMVSLSTYGRVAPLIITVGRGARLVKKVEFVSVLCN